MDWDKFLKDNGPPPPYNYGKAVLPNGPMDAKLVLLGEAPGEDEVRLGRGFVGTAGRILDRILHEAGINRASCFVANVAWERPPQNKFRPFFYELQMKPRKRYVPSKRLKQWWITTSKMLREINPNVVVAFGNEPLFALLGLTGITKRRGSIYRHPDGYKVIPVVHPAAVMRAWKMRTVAIHDLQRALVESVSKDYKEPNLSIKVEPTYEDVVDYLMYCIEERCQVTIDLETRGNHIACLGIGHLPDFALVIPFMRTVGHYWKEEREAHIIALLTDILLNNPIDGQNFTMFDSYIFWMEWGVVPRNIVIDTMHCQHLLYPEKFGPNMGHGLEFMTSLYTDPVINYYKDEGKIWERKIGEKQFWTYCGKDVCSTRQSSMRLEEELKKKPVIATSEIGNSSSMTNQWEKYVHHVQPLATCLQSLLLQGVLVDQDRQASLYSENQHKIAWMQSVIDHTLNESTEGFISSLNVRSHKQMKSLLYDYWNLPRQYKRDKGKKKLSVDENAIVQIRNKYKSAAQFFELLLKQKEVLKEQDFLQTPVAPDGRMRTVLSVSGTETGRLSSRTPPCGYGTNLQNVKPKLRQIIIPDPGYEFWEVDGSQAEARVVAVLAQQWDLVDLFERGDIDVHWENAKRIFELDPRLDYNANNTEQYRMRYLAKRIIHASNYGMSWYKFRQLLLTDAGIDMSKREVENLLESYHKIYPNIRGVFHTGVVRQLRKDRELVNPFGRSRIFYDRWPSRGKEGELFRQAYAYLPQSTIVDLINFALYDFWVWSHTTMDRVRVVHQVHDSILYQVKPSYSLAAAQKIKELMERPIQFKHATLTIPCDFKRGMRWGYEMQEVSI